VPSYPQIHYLVLCKFIVVRDRKHVSHVFCGYVTCNSLLLQFCSIVFHHVVGPLYFKSSIWLHVFSGLNKLTICGLCASVILRTLLSPVF
jgi:hypothetical protein